MCENTIRGLERQKERRPYSQPSWARSAEPIEKRLADIEKRLAEADPLTRLRLFQDGINLRQELRKSNISDQSGINKKAGWRWRKSR